MVQRRCRKVDLKSRRFASEHERDEALRILSETEYLIERGIFVQRPLPRKNRNYGSLSRNGDGQHPEDNDHRMNFEHAAWTGAGSITGQPSYTSQPPSHSTSSQAVDDNKVVSKATECSDNSVATSNPSKPVPKAENLVVQATNESKGESAEKDFQEPQKEGQKTPMSEVEKQAKSETSHKQDKARQAKESSKRPKPTIDSSKAIEEARPIASLQDTSTSADFPPLSQTMKTEQNAASKFPTAKVQTKTKSFAEIASQNKAQTGKVATQAPSEAEQVKPIA